MAEPNPRPGARLPVDELVAALVSPAPRCRDLRQCSPFAGLLPDDERARVLDAWSAQQ